MPTTETTLSDTLFDLGTGFDEPRARLTDPVTSHMAADRSGESKAAVSAAVLVLLRQEQTLTGSVANELYMVRRERNGWPRVHFDSPRKRLGDLAREGAVSILNPNHPRGTETEYTILEASA